MSEHTITTVGDLIKLWENNEQFKSAVGPTFGHLYLWLDKEKFVRLDRRDNQIVDTKCVISNFDEHNVLPFKINNPDEVFLCVEPSLMDNNSFENYICQYINHLYRKEDEFDFQGFTNDKARFLTYAMKIMYVIKYQIKQVESNTILLAPTSIDVESLYELYKLGYKYTSDYLKINSYVDRKKLYKYKREGVSLLANFNIFSVMVDLIALYPGDFNKQWDLIEEFRHFNEFWIITNNIDNYKQPEHKQLFEICTRLCTNKNKIFGGVFQFVYYYFVVNDVIQVYDSKIALTRYIYPHIDAILHLYPTFDINKKTSNGSYLIQFAFQDKRFDIVDKLLDKGAKFLDNNYELIKGVDGIDIVGFMDGYRNSYSHLRTYYRNDNVILNLIDKAYAKYIKPNPVKTVNKDSIKPFVIKIDEPKVEEPKVEEPKEALTLDQQIKADLFSYYAKLMSEKEKIE